MDFQKDKDSVRLYKWQHCHLTQQKLTKPIVACELGFLYNKEAVIEKLLDSKGNKDSDSNKNDIGSHIRSLKVSVRFASVEHASSVFQIEQGYEGQLLSPVAAGETKMPEGIPVAVPDSNI